MIYLCINKLNMDNILKGLNYELYINAFLNSLPETKIAYLWNDVPEQVLFDADLITDYNKHRMKRKDGTLNSLQDIGIDIILINKNDEIMFIQCKNYTISLKLSDLGGFLGQMMSKNHRTKHGVVYHSTNRLSIHLKELMPYERIEFIHKPMTKAKIVNNEIKLYDYQKEIVKLYNTHYETEN